MKGIILAGGTGSRLRPLTRVVNKHLLPVGEYPMIHYGLEKLRSAGIDRIHLVTGKQSAALFAEYVGSGREYGLRVSFSIQEEAGGVAEALGCAESFVGPGEKIVVLLGDNLFGDDLSPYVSQFERQGDGAVVFLAKVGDARRYGCPVLEGDRIVRIIEKPDDPPSTYCVTGIYMYDSGVFDIIRGLQPSGRGELEITDVNNAYAQAGKLRYHELTDWWLDAGTFPSLREAEERMRRDVAAADGAGTSPREGAT